MPRTTFSIVKQTVSSIFAFFEKAWKFRDFGIHFGIIFEAFGIIFLHLFGIVFLYVFLGTIFSTFMPKCSILGSSCGPAGAKMAPKIAQVAPKGSKRMTGALTFWGPGSDLLPETVSERSRAPFWLISDRFLIDFWWICGRCLAKSHVFRDPFLVFIFATFLKAWKNQTRPNKIK